MHFSISKSKIHTNARAQSRTNAFVSHVDAKRTPPTKKNEPIRTPRSRRRDRRVRVRVDRG
jgi:hypothetical protein